MIEQGLDPELEHALDPELVPELELEPEPKIESIIEPNPKSMSNLLYALVLEIPAKPTKTSFQFRSF